ncbi:agmatine deiminase family protein, partial [Enterococcus faecalis]|uniref:agmatine deiminase family protein n=1 Tax=Enterococcus faecalis TaxID=1351 RepID=UPI003CC5880D
TMPREDGDFCIASYMNFLITNDGEIVPQYGDENVCLALEQVQTMFPDKKIVGVNTEEVVYGGGNIHCITQQERKR